MLIKKLSIIQLAEQSRKNYPLLDTVAEKKFLQCDFTTKDNFSKYGVYGGIEKQLFILVHLIGVIISKAWTLPEIVNSIHRSIALYMCDGGKRLVLCLVALIHHTVQPNRTLHMIHHISDRQREGAINRIEHSTWYIISAIDSERGY